MNSSILFNASPGVADRRLYHNLQIQQSDGLIEINDDGNAVLKVDTTSTISGNRKSVRITTENTFTGTYDSLLLSYYSDHSNGPYRRHFRSRCCPYAPGLRFMAVGV